MHRSVPSSYKNTLACFCMRPALPGELYEIFASLGELYKNLALITGHCMEYTLACIWCYYYDDGLEFTLLTFCVFFGPSPPLPSGYQLSNMHCTSGSAGTGKDLHRQEALQIPPMDWTEYSRYTHTLWIVMWGYQCENQCLGCRLFMV